MGDMLRWPIESNAVVSVRGEILRGVPVIPVFVAFCRII